MMSPGAGIRGTFQEDITPKETDGESSGIKKTSNIQLPGYSDF